MSLYNTTLTSSKYISIIVYSGKSSGVVKGSVLVPSPYNEQEKCEINMHANLNFVKYLTNTLTKISKYGPSLEVNWKRARCHAQFLLVVQYPELYTFPGRDKLRSVLGIASHGINMVICLGMS